MIKSLLSAALLSSGIMASSAFAVSFQELDGPEAVIDLKIVNTSGLPDSQVLQELIQELKQQPAKFANKEVHLCVEEECDTIDAMDFMVMQTETMDGQKEVVKASDFAREVGGVVGQVIGGMHGSASATVKYKETDKKTPDGGTEHTKEVEVSITVSGGKK